MDSLFICHLIQSFLETVSVNKPQLFQESSKGQRPKNGRKADNNSDIYEQSPNFKDLHHNETSRAKTDSFVKSSAQLNVKRLKRTLY